MQVDRVQFLMHESGGVSNSTRSTSHESLTDLLPYKTSVAVKFSFASFLPLACGMMFLSKTSVTLVPQNSNFRTSFGDQ